MDAQACPRCKTTKYRNPSLKLMVNVCGHVLCESCVDLLFVKGTGSCPECMVPLRRNNFRIQLFEDPNVEKDVDIRRRILRDYNKREEDFPNAMAYNNYLEEIETIIYNLCNNIDIIGTNKRIEAYKRENREVIQRNRTRMGREEQELEEMLELEHAQEEARRQELLALEIEQKKKKAETKAALIQELMLSNKDAKEIINEFAEKALKQREEEKKLPPPKPVTEFSSGCKLGGEKTFLPLPKEDDDPLYVYKPQVIYSAGPPAPSMADIESKNYLMHLRQETVVERAGGFRSNIACHRILQEAMQGLFYTPA